MKINEKNLCAYSVSPTHIDKEGYLLKKGEVNKNFQRRWFVLKGNLLFYFEKKGDREPIGVIILEGCTIELAECEDQFTFKLVFHGGGGRVYVLAADSQESLEVWMKALARASYDYLKLMVAELQKQLDELNELQRGHPGPHPGHAHEGQHSVWRGCEPVPELGDRSDAPPDRTATPIRGPHPGEPTHLRADPL
ncbi:hypothetical protein O3P69_016718 [Scylla paramamosain]|uniref:PH domain-containing protein n=1 Tax=Scylla paramamosain TaxID=85552 RepID=A0AAW0SZ69_SCYPA